MIMIMELTMLDVEKALLFVFFKSGIFRVVDERINMYASNFIRYQ